MKKAGLGLITGIVLILALLGGYAPSGNLFAQYPQPSVAPGTGGELTVMPIASGDKGQLIVVVDQRQRVMSVYRIDAASGKIALKSVRNINSDLQMKSYNNEAPLPQEIESLKQ